MLEFKSSPIPNASRPRMGLERKQPRRLLLALGILLLALVAVIIRDHDFWFGNDESALDDETTETAQPIAARSTPTATPAVVPETAPSAVQTTAHTGKPAEANKKQSVLTAKNAASKLKTETKATETKAAGAKSTDAGVVTQRTVLPPLDVEVVAGDTHRTVHPGSNTTKLDITKSSSAPAVAAADRQRLAATQTAPGSYEASYPTLAQHTNVEGSVVLQALISADGSIENLRVLSGPSILTAAAQQAVREWHFKPYLHNGQPVETKAKITVNFSIKVSENAAKTS